MSMVQSPPSEANSSSVIKKIKFYVTQCILVSKRASHLTLY